jgi:hypothetical protein
MMPARWTITMPTRSFQPGVPVTIHASAAKKRKDESRYPRNPREGGIASA